MSEGDLKVPEILMSTLAGALVLGSDGGWRWRDGAPEPRVSTLRLRDIAPNFRCITFGNGRTYVEIPHRWQRDVTDPDVRAAIRELVQDRGRPADIFAEAGAVALDDHRVTQKGYLVPVDDWDVVMQEPCGATWDKKDEEAIFERARALGWRTEALR